MTQDVNGQSLHDATWSSNKSSDVEVIAYKAFTIEADSVEDPKLSTLKVHSRHLHQGIPPHVHGAAVISGIIVRKIGIDDAIRLVGRMLCSFQQFADALGRANCVRIQDHGVVITGVWVRAIACEQGNVLLTAPCKSMSSCGKVFWRHLLRLRHIVREAKAGRSYRPSQLSVVFTEVGKGLIHAGGCQDHQVLILSRLLEDAAVPVEINEMMGCILHSLQKVCTVRLLITPGTNPCGIHSLQPVVHAFRGALADGLQGLMHGSAPHLEAFLRSPHRKALWKDLEQNLQLIHESLHNLRPTSISAVHLTANDRKVTGNADHGCGDEVFGIQVGQMRVTGRLEALLRTLLLP
mmetsp:Transcript_33893/g.54338  ORF Transcript_33893/g.54338 Transcript_33893/m.54338 type:complete len:350 (-) Transcript_33893:1232-2281(-)